MKGLGLRVQDLMVLGLEKGSGLRGLGWHASRTEGLPAMVRELALFFRVECSGV